MSLAHASILLAAAVSTPDCSYDPEALIRLPFDQFDQDVTGGWRTLEYKGCLEEAAKLLRRYRLEHQPLTEKMRSLLYWHEGQMFAIIGNYKRAIPLLLAGVPADDTIDFADYSLGTVAFLLHDKAGLRAARARLAATPKPIDWTDNMTTEINGKNVIISMKWPPNINVLDGLTRCFDRPYSQAYRCQSFKLGVHP